MQTITMIDFDCFLFYLLFPSLFNLRKMEASFIIYTQYCSLSLYNSDWCRAPKIALLVNK